MSASLVGSEMCIRDSLGEPGANHGVGHARRFGARAAGRESSGASVQLVWRLARRASSSPEVLK
eukprot:7323271-Alexandrium_andersonii.AAC.1